MNCLNRKNTLRIGSLLLLAVILTLLATQGVRLQRAVFYHPVFQRHLLSPIRSTSSALEKILQMKGEPETQAARLYGDLKMARFLGEGSGDESTPRVFLLCLDATNWDDIEAFAPLENFSRLKREGAWGTHDSTILPISSCAWNAIDTGYLPAQTGVLAFQRSGDKWPLRWKPIGPSDFPTKTIAQRVEEQGGGAFSLNLMNSHARQLRSGLLIGGMWIDVEGAFTNPPSLSGELRERGYDPTPEINPRYRLVGFLGVVWLMATILLLKIGGRKKRTLVVSLAAGAALVLLIFSMLYLKKNREMRSSAYRLRVYLEEEFYPRLEMLRQLYESPGWRFGALYLQGIDQLGHYRYQHEEVRREYYQALDRLVGYLLNQADERTLVAVVSDHGFQYYDKAFSLPAWLYREGYITDDPETTRASVDHESSGNVGCIRLRDPSEAEDLKLRLENLRDPLNGKPLFTRILLRDSAFQGDQIDAMPDLVLESDLEYEIIAYSRALWPKRYRWRYQAPPNDDPLYSAKTPYGPPLKRYEDWYLGGYHNRAGMVALWGKEIIQPGGKGKIAIEEIAPTLMVPLDLPLPEDFLGEPQVDWFTAEFMQDHPVRTIPDPLTPAPEISGNEVIDPDSLEKLENLDYLK